MPTCPNCKHEWGKTEQITFNPEKRKFEGITPDDLSYWVGQFPAVNIEQELAKMEAWLYANPKNRKSKYVRFITNWLSKAQDKAPRVVIDRNMGKIIPRENVPSWKQGPV